eukprot:NODE_5366_length_665_cov_27.353160_g5203_i0.p1 GENE.NODE_5366_length_665_cov_27.353160_g5203_i0~~NODE_5366_length_665_cov_27.353160_g5203_i0.p1  ORF type:complete len:196 (+),score=44.38 NODE_5366_length_665_cov_27.353160_g5203_i0:33-620(+)
MESLKRKLSEIANPPEGRHRCVEHQPGMWATHLYLPIAIDVPPTVSVPLGFTKTEGPLHVSLSRTLYLQQREIAPLLDEITQVIHSTPPFTLTFTGTSIFANEEGTTSFLGLSAGKGKAAYVRLVRALNGVVRGLHLPPYFHCPKPHCSVAWAKGDHTATAYPSQPFKPIRCSFTSVCMKAGNVIHTIPMAVSST